MRVTDPSTPTSGAVIVIDPHELDTAASACENDSVEALEGYLATFGSAEGVDLPMDVRGSVIATVQHAARDLLALSDEFDALGRHLRRKAAQARLADGDQGAALAMDLAPILRFSEGEDHWLDDPAFFPRHSKPVGDGYRDLEDRCHAGANSRSKNLYQWDPRTRQLTYWFFYAFNDGTNNHEGDWERVTIRFRQDGNPSDMLFSAHTHTRRVAWKDVEKDPSTGQPVVYVSKGSHAVVPHRGDYGTDVPKTPLTDDDAHGDGPRLDLAERPVLDVTRQPWYPHHGKGIHWGNKQRLPGFIPHQNDFEGPLGPSPDKGHLE
jgi:hypothetical protein